MSREALGRLKGRTVALDFDGVLHAYTSGWTGPTPEDGPIDGAREFVELLLDGGVDVVVFTTRARETDGMEATVAWLLHHGFPDVRVTAEKPLAIAYVDDRAVPFRGSWSDALAAAADLAS